MAKSQDLTAHLLDAGNYRDFLRCQFGNSKGYASFARKAGFSSRSYPRDVANGKKRIGLASLPKFIQALDLRGPLKSYFTLLVMLDEAEVNVTGISREKLLQKLAKLKNRIEFAEQPPLLAKNANWVFGEESWPEIYAALGSTKIGATTAEIAGRTGIEVELCKSALARMASLKLATYDEQGKRFLPCHPHLIFDLIGGRITYQKYFQRSVEWMGRAAKHGFDRDDRLYFTSAISVKRADLSLLKKELREVLLRFSDHAERAEGDCVVRICAGMLPTR